MITVIDPSAVKVMFSAGCRYVLANVNFPKIKQFFKVTNVKEEGMIKVDIFLLNEPYLYDDDEMENISKIEHLLPPFKKLTYEEYCSTLRTQFN